MIRSLLASLCLAAMTGCSGLRFVVDTQAPIDELTETVVLGNRERGGSAKVALIEVTGLIIDANKPGLLAPGENPLGRFVEAINRAAEDTKVKAVVLRINSPGGTVTASDVMHREVARFRAETGKPVVVLMADVAASGGYYLACAGDEIIAHPTTVTGSIGVIIQTFNFAEGMKKIGISADAITSGPNKKMGSPFEPMPAEHRELLQGLVDEFYSNFVAVVKAGRPDLNDDDLLWITDGRVVSGAQAAEAGLVDRTGDLHDAFDAAKVRAGLTSARLVKYHRPIEFVGSAFANAPTPSAAQINLLQLNVDDSLLTQPGFYYLWSPAVE